MEPIKKIQVAPVHTAVEPAASLPSNTVSPVQKTVFARMNESWFEKGSTSTHHYFQKNPQQWNDYHATFRSARQSWEATPADEMIALYQNAKAKVIGDFGCGEAMIGRALEGRHQVHSFDHVAANPSVTACDIAHVPLADGSLDVAIFSLALMGNNFTSYLEEAHRVLKNGGTLHIIEMTRRFTDKDGFLAGLQRKGYAVQDVAEMWRFTHITAVKNCSVRPSQETLIF